MTRRRRILLAVQPRVLRDALGVVLDSVGLDEVLVYDAHAADRSTMSFDAAILSQPRSDVLADVVIEVQGEGAEARGHVTAGERREDVPLRTPQQLLSLLDRFCPTTAARVSLIGGGHR